MSSDKIQESKKKNGKEGAKKIRKSECSNKCKAKKVSKEKQKIT
jgi:hypothetical protein